MIDNKHNVSKRQWAKWTDHARDLFNTLYDMMADQGLFTHPDMKRIVSQHWDTIRWNAAWMAVSAASISEKRRKQPAPRLKRVA